MDFGPESVGPRRPIRVLALGTSDWLRSAATAIADEGLAVDGPRARLEGGPAESVDCVLVDDPTLAAAVDGQPVVAAIDDPDAIADALDSGIDDVVDRDVDADPALLVHRLRRAVQWKATSRTVEEREAWYQALIERSSALLFVLDEDRYRRYASPSVQRIAGYEPEALVGRRADDVIHPDDREAFVDAFETVQSREQGATASCEYRVRHADGTWRLHEAILTNRLGDPTVEGVVVSVRDVTDYYRVERELSNTLDRIDDAFFSLDGEWRFTYLNDRAEEIFGRDESELLGRPFLQVFPEIEGTPFQTRPVEAMRTQEPQTVEAYSDELDRWIEGRIYPSPSGISVYFRDVTERVERERELEKRTERLQALVANVPIVLFVLDDEGTFTLLEGRALEDIDVDPNEAVGTSAFDALADRPDICADVRQAVDGSDVYACREFSGRIFETWFRPVIDDGDVERVIGVSIDVTERFHYEKALSALHEATRELLTVESATAAFDHVVDVAADVLELENAVVFRFDERDNQLVPVAQSDDVVENLGESPRMKPGDGISWEVYVSREARLYDDVQTSPAVHEDATRARSGIFVPLGDHGVLVAATPEPGEYDSNAFELAQLLGATAETALDRIERTRDLHEQERKLQEQNDRLERLNRASWVREDVQQLLLRADDREEIESGVCERLVDLEECTFAWIGEPDLGGNQLLPRARAGDDHGYLDAVTVTTVEDPAAEPAGRSARTRRPTTVANVADSMRDGDWCTEALARDLQSVVSVPLVYDDFLYGVCTVYADRHDGFDHAITDTLYELGETIAYSIDAIERKNVLRSEDVVELELHVDAESPLVGVSRLVDSSVRLEDAIPRANGSTVAFVTVDGSVEPDAVVDVDGIVEATELRETDDGTLLQLQLADGVLETLAEAHTGRIRSLSVDQTGIDARIDVPRTVEIRQVLTELGRRGLDVSLVAQRTRSRDGDGSIRTDPWTTVFDELTDRQREVVQTAYHGGFFEWPRETTGEEVADSLDISPPAFHNHVRAAERKLFTTLFERDVGTDG